MEILRIFEISAREFGTGDYLKTLYLLAEDKSTIKINIWGDALPKFKLEEAGSPYIGFGRRFQMKLTSQSKKGLVAAQTLSQAWIWDYYRQENVVQRQIVLYSSYYCNMNIVINLSEEEFSQLAGELPEYFKLEFEAITIELNTLVMIDELSS